MRFLHKLQIGFIVLNGLVCGICQWKQNRNLVRFQHLPGRLAIPSERISYGNQLH